MGVHRIVDVGIDVDLKGELGDRDMMIDGVFALREERSEELCGGFARRGNGFCGGRRGFYI